MPLLLSQAEINTNYIVMQVGQNRRLFEYGFFIGTKIFVLGHSPQKQSILIFINGGMVALRLSLAELVTVECL